MKKYVMTMITTVAALSLISCGNYPAEEETTLAPTTVQETMEAVDMTGWKVPVDFANGELLSGTHHIEIVLKDYGTIAVELDANVAPISVTNFMYLAQQGFYKNLTFHRIMDGFMMQGGAPSATSKNVNTIKGEFKSNGVANDISHVRGTISMARAKANDSASSQFFIVHQDSTFLDGQYAGFGHVTAGMEIVDQICGNKGVQGENGAVEPENQPIIEDIIVID